MNRIHMGDEVSDIVIGSYDDSGATFITVAQDGVGGAIFMTPEGARSLAYTIIGMTDEMRRKETSNNELDPDKLIPCPSCGKSGEDWGEDGDRWQCQYCGEWHKKEDHHHE